MELRPQRRSLASLWSARQAIDRRVVAALDSLQIGGVGHWLALANTGLLMALGLAVLAPALLALQQPQLATPIYWSMHAVCHQWPFRAFFLFGPQATYTLDEILALAGPDRVWTYLGSAEAGYRMPFCERNLAILLGALAMGLFYTRVRRRLAPPRLGLYLVLLAPILLDGLTQLVGWRESTWEFRMATGAIAGWATVWLLYPYLELRADLTLAATARWATPPQGGPLALS